LLCKIAVCNVLSGDGFQRGLDLTTIYESATSMRREKLVPEPIMAIEAQQEAEAFHLAPEGFRYARMFREGREMLGSIPATDANTG
jgi:hypothetical protein